MKSRMVGIISSVVLVLSLLVGSLACAAPAPAAPATPAAPAAPAAPAPAAVVELKVASYIPEMLPDWIALKKTVDYIVQQSNGKVKATYYPTGSLVSQAQTWDAVLSGMCDITCSNTTITPGRFPLTEVIGLPPFYNKLEDSAREFEWHSRFLQNPEWTKEFADFKVLSVNPNPPSSLMANKPVKTVEDVKGMRVCGTGSVMDPFIVWGATPTNIGFAEAYEAIQRGTADAVYAAVFGARARKWAEVAPYATDLGTNASVIHVMMSRKRYDSLPPDVKKLVDDAFPSKMLQFAVEANQAGLTGTADYINKAGGKVITLSPQEMVPFRVSAMKALNDKWAAEKDAKGLPGTKILQERYKWLKQFMPEVFSSMGL